MGQQDVSSHSMDAERILADAANSLVPTGVDRSLEGAPGPVTMFDENSGLPIFRPNDRVVVIEATATDSEDPVQLVEGLRGRIVEVDEEGNVAVDFDGIEKEQWICDDKRHHLRIDDTQFDYPPMQPED